MITSNHVHLLIKDTGPNVIADSMQLIAGRTAQEYNQHKDRQGAFWEDRYHATAIEADEHPYTHARGRQFKSFKSFNRCALFKTLSG